MKKRHRVKPIEVTEEEYRELCPHACRDEEDMENLIAAIDRGIRQRARLNVVRDDREADRCHTIDEVQGKQRI